MKKLYFGFLFLITALLFIGVFYVNKLPVANNSEFSSSSADISQTPYDEISKGKVIEVLSLDAEMGRRYSRITQLVSVDVLTDKGEHKVVEALYDDQLVNQQIQEIKVGDKIVVGKINIQDEISYVVIEKNRLSELTYLTLFFLFVVVVFGRTRGVTSILGMSLGFVILLSFITPNLLLGKSPTLVVLIGSGLIVMSTIFLAHGFKMRTVISVISTILTLCFANVMASIVVSWSKILGNGVEAAYYLQQGYFNSLNLRGLFLGGIIIVTLGILNDVTTSQAATVEELFWANPKLTIKELFSKASSVGQEHIASLINTLVLVYAGSSLPLFLLLTMNKSQPVWAILNSAPIAEEIIRTVVGGTALILALPITTLLTALYFKKSTLIIESRP